MNRADKERIIRGLIASVKKTVLENVARMPAEWDGFELRQYVADKFKESSPFSYDATLRTRAKNYRNEVLVRNL